MSLMRLSFSVLDGLLQRLTGRVYDELIDHETYLEEYDRLVELAGWTQEELNEEIDRQWTEPRRYAEVFLC